MMTLRLLRACVWLCVVSGTEVFAQVTAPSLPPPAGTVVTVATVAALQAAVAALTTGTTIMLQPGRYALTSELWVRNVTDVALRGATGNRNDVVVVGPGMGVSGTPVNVAIHVWQSSHVLVANMSIGEVWYHPIQLHGEAATNDIRLYNVRLFNGGQQLLKASTNYTDGVDRGLVEYSALEYTDSGPPNGYTNGVDVLFGKDWIIRYNLFRNIRSTVTMAGPAVLMWRGSANTQTYGNVFINCERAIVYGLQPDSLFLYDHEGGSIVNNFVYRAVGGVVHPDAGISAWDSPRTAIVHNTVIQNHTYPAAIEARFSTTTGVVIENNLTDGAITLRDGAQATRITNITTALPSWFVSPATGDLHLQATAVDAIDTATPEPSVTEDIDTQSRVEPTDVGADEIVLPSGGEDTTPPTVAIVSVVRAGKGKSGNFTVTVTATDAVGVAFVELRLDGALVGPDVASPYTFVVKPAPGTHALLATARDAAGNSSVASGTVTR